MTDRTNCFLCIALGSALLVGCAGKKVKVTPEGEAPEGAIVYMTVLQVTGSPAQLTTDPSNNGLGSYHPDGQRIAFQSDRDGRWQIYQMNLSDKSEERLVSSEANDENPVWMPDGAGLLFVSDRNSTGDEFRRDIFYYDPLSVVTATLANDSADDWFPVPVTPEAYIFLSERGNEAGLPVYSRLNGLYFGELNGNAPKLFRGKDANLTSPVNLRDGRILVRTDEARLGILDEAGDINIITPPALKCGTAAYLPERHAIAFTARQSETYELYFMDRESLTLQKVEEVAGEVRYPQFSPDGLHLLFSQEIDGHFQLFQLDLAQ